VRGQWPSRAGASLRAQDLQRIDAGRATGGQEDGERGNRQEQNAGAGERPRVTGCHVE